MNQKRNYSPGLQSKRGSLRVSDDTKHRGSGRKSDIYDWIIETSLSKLRKIKKIEKENFIEIFKDFDKFIEFVTENNYEKVDKNSINKKLEIIEKWFIECSKRSGKTTKTKNTSKKITTTTKEINGITNSSNNNNKTARTNKKKKVQKK